MTTLQCRSRYKDLVGCELLEGHEGFHWHAEQASGLYWNEIPYGKFDAFAPRKGLTEQGGQSYLGSAVPCENDVSRQHDEV